MEDLDSVLTRISNRSGVNGPQSPVTQYILQQAAERLADRLVGDIDTSLTGEGVPRVLSAALGHQPFIGTVLGMSQHQMLRRWPMAGDWYTDVVNYVMRPARFDFAHTTTLERMAEWATKPLGEYIRLFTDHQAATVGNRPTARIAEVLQLLWPDYPPVREALETYRATVNESWVPIYSQTMNLYGLKLRPEVSIEEVAWMLNAVYSRDTLERLANVDVVKHDESNRARWNMTARSALLITAGIATDLDGRQLSLTDLEHRRPQNA